MSTPILLFRMQVGPPATRWPHRSIGSLGEVAERLKAPVLKTGVPARAPRVRISPSPSMLLGRDRCARRYRNTPRQSRRTHMTGPGEVPERLPRPPDRDKGGVPPVGESMGGKWASASFKRLGEVAERLKAPVSKTGVPARVPRVRISPSPPFFERPMVSRRRVIADQAGARSDGPQLFLNVMPVLSVTKGEVSERLKEHDWKSCSRPKGGSRVRIPASPLFFADENLLPSRSQPPHGMVTSA